MHATLTLILILLHRCLSFGFSNALVLPETGIGADAPVNSVAGHRLSKSMDIGLVSVSLAVLFALVSMVT